MQTETEAPAPVAYAATPPPPMLPRDIPPPGIALALMQAAIAVRRVARNARNEGEAYDYAQVDDVVQEAKDAIARANLMVHRLTWTLAASPIQGHPPRIVVQYIFALQRARPTGEEGGVFEVRETWLPPVVSTPIFVKREAYDKAEAAALSYNLNYYLLGLLMIPRTPREADVDARDDAGGSKQPSRTTAPKRERAKPGDAGADALLGVIKRASRARDLDGCRARYEALKKEGLSPRVDEAIRDALELRAGELTPVDGEGTQAPPAEGAAA